MDRQMNVFICINPNFRTHAEEVNHQPSVNSNTLFWVFLNICCVNWNVLHRYHLFHSVVNKHFIMADNHTIFTIFYYLRSRDVICHFFKFVKVIFLSIQHRRSVTLGHSVLNSLDMDCTQGITWTASLGKYEKNRKNSAWNLHISYQK